MKWHYLLSLFLISFLPVIFSCGGTSETGNARIASLSGSILINDCDTDKVWIHLVNENYIPGTDTSEMVYKVAADVEGEYHFNSVQCNNYYLYIKGKDRNLLRGPFPVSVPDIELGKDTLHYTSRVTVNIPDSAGLDFVFIRGIPELYSIISGKAVLPNAPEGSIEIIAQSKQNSTSPLDTTSLKQTIILNVIQGDTVSVGLYTAAPVFEKTSFSMSRVVNLDCTRRYQDVLLVTSSKSDSITFRILQAPSDLRLNPSNGVISWIVPDSMINRALTIGAVAENIHGSSRSIWWTVTFQNTCSLSVRNPNRPIGPDSGLVNLPYSFCADSIDQNRDLLYRFQWGDSTVSQWNTSVYQMHNWTTPGTYEVRIQTATSDTSAISTPSDPHLISIGIQTITSPASRPQIRLSTDTIPAGQKIFLSVIDDSCSTFYTLVKWNDTTVNNNDTTVNNWERTTLSSHVYNNPGVYSAYVTIIREQPYSDTVTDTCNINVIPLSTADNTPPVVTLFGESEIRIPVYTPYQDSGVTAIDDRDGDISSSVRTITNLDISKAASYFFLYTAKDAAGNVATVIRKIVVE